MVCLACMWSIQSSFCAKYCCGSLRSSGIQTYISASRSMLSWLYKHTNCKIAYFQVPAFRLVKLRSSKHSLQGTYGSVPCCFGNGGYSTSSKSAAGVVLPVLTMEEDGLMRCWSWPTRRTSEGGTVAVEVSGRSTFNSCSLS